MTFTASVVNYLLQLSGVLDMWWNYY